MWRFFREGEGEEVICFLLEHVVFKGLSTPNLVPVLSEMTNLTQYPFLPNSTLFLMGICSKCPRLWFKQCWYRRIACGIWLASAVILIQDTNLQFKYCCLWKVCVTMNKANFGNFNFIWIKKFIDHGNYSANNNHESYKRHVSMQCEMTIKNVNMQWRLLTKQMTGLIGYYWKWHLTSKNVEFDPAIW